MGQLVVGEIRSLPVFNRYPQMPSKKGFEWMGLDEQILKGVRKKGYSTPTPIQRKAIPLALDGRDVVAMARTGSGKTAAYLLPLFQHLLVHTHKVGIKALILSPTRELAQQIWKFAKELGHYLPFRFALLTGGDKIERHFSLIHSAPDFIIATPGRLLHLMMEMELKLESVSYVVLDEADRLFELGFYESLQETFARIPREKQLLLFSATLPQMLAEFATAKLSNPTLIRLDLEQKLSPSLTLSSFLLRQEDKEAALLHLLRQVIPEGSLTAVFLPTRCHVEYFRELLSQNSLKCSYLYSSLDHTARKIQTALFFRKQTSYLLVTDIAARGIDIPWLDYVINFDLPPPKIFLHRVGRVARAGRVGTAFSLVCSEEVAYLFDLTLFLGCPLREEGTSTETTNPVLSIGSVPPSVLYTEIDSIHGVKRSCSDIGPLEQAMHRAYKKYLLTKPLTNVESVRRGKEFLASNELRCHSLFADRRQEESVLAYRKALKSYRPAMTVFEIQSKGKKSAAKRMVSAQRKEHTLSLSPLETGAQFRDETFLNYREKDSFTNEQLSVNSSIRNNVVEMPGDEDANLSASKHKSKWDRKRKRFVNADSEANTKKIKSESGQWIKASFKKDTYKRWLDRNKVHSNDAQKILARAEGKGTKGTARQPLAQRKTKRKHIGNRHSKSGKRGKKYKK